MKEIFISLGYVAAVVALPLIIAVAVAGWWYRRALIREMDQKSREAADPVFPEPARFRRRFATTAEARAAALDVTAGTRRAQVLAWLGYATVTSMVAIAYVGLSLTAIVAVIYALLLPQLVILTWSLRWPVWRSVLAVLLFAVAGAVVVLLLWGNARAATPVILQILVGFLIQPAVVLFVLFVPQLRAFVLLGIAAAIEIGAVALYLLYFRPESVPKDLPEVMKQPGAVALGMAAIVAGVIIAVVLLRGSWAVRLGGFVAALAGAVFVDLAFGRFSLAVLAFLGVATTVLEVFMIWGAFKVIVSLPLTNELVQTHLCWIVLTAYFERSTQTAFFADQIPARWGLLLALVAYFVIFHTLLWRVRRRCPRQASMRLLLLRVFGRADKHEGLLRELDDSWRRIGAVDLIAGTDVASRAMTSTMLEAFFLRRGDEQFLKTAAEVDRRIEALRFDIEADARYPVNAVYCYDNTWRRAFSRLAAGADAVLMDLRGFKAKNKNCAWELGYLLRNFDLERIVLLTNSRTETAEIERIKREAGVIRELDVGGNPLFDRLLRAALS